MYALRITERVLEPVGSGVRERVWYSRLGPASSEKEAVQKAQALLNQSRYIKRVGVMFVRNEHDFDLKGVFFATEGEG